MSSRIRSSFHLIVAGAGFDLEGASAGFGEKDGGVHGCFSGGLEVEEEAVTVMERFFFTIGFDLVDIVIPFFVGGVLFRLDHKKIAIGPAPVDDDVGDDVFPFLPVTVADGDSLDAVFRADIPVELAVDVPAGEDLLKVEAQAERQGAFVHVVLDQIQIVEVEEAQSVVHRPFDVIGFGILHHFTS